MTALCVAIGASSLFAATAVSQDPGDGSLHVSPEPAGENCPAGGIKLVIQRGELDSSEPVLMKKKEDQPDEIFYICNGINGKDGAPGATGPPGPVVVIPPNPDEPPKKCFSSARLGVRFFLPKRLRDFPSLRLVIRGPNSMNIRLNKIMRVRTPLRGGNEFVFVPMRARNCGEYIISINGPANVKPVFEKWEVTGGFGLRREKAS
jgi:hypothetical protein